MINWFWEGWLDHSIKKYIEFSTNDAVTTRYPHAKRTKMYSQLTLYKNTLLKQVKGLHLRYTSKKILEEYIKVNLHYLGLEISFLDTPKAQMIIEKIGKLNFMKLEMFVYKKYPQESEKSLWNESKYLQVMNVIRISIKNV